MISGDGQRKLTATLPITITRRSKMAKRQCTEPYCDKPRRGRGLCSKHYIRAKRAGELPPLPTTLDRFEEKYIPEPNSGCWLWTASLVANGYGHWWYLGRNERAHRASYLIHKGPIPQGMYVLHKCDTRCCVNPEHLFLGTHQDNMDDMAVKGRTAKGCRQGFAKLTDQAVRDIRDSDLYGWQLADIYGVAKSVIDKARRGETWKHVI